MRKRKREKERDSGNEFLFVWWLVIILPQHPLPFLSLLFLPFRFALRIIFISILFYLILQFLWKYEYRWLNKWMQQWMNAQRVVWESQVGIYLMKIPHLQIRQLVNNNLRVLVIMTQLVDKTHSSHYSNGLPNICLPVPSYLRCWVVVSTACWKTNKEIQQQKTENWRLRTATHKTDAHKSLQSVI